MIKDYQVKVKSKKFLNDSTVELSFDHLDGFDYLSGQFLMLKIDSFFLRRPFVIVDNKIIFKICGDGTKQLSQIPIGEKVSLLMPLGKHFPKTTNKKVILIGGGIGTASIVPLLNDYYNKNNIISFLGFDSSSSIFYENEFKNKSELYISTDDGTCGFNGNVVDLLVGKLDLIKDATIYACGPNIMLKNLALFLEKHKINDAYFSLEERMACGVGACYGCAVKTIDGIKKACSDGPIFKASEIIWE